MTRRALRGIISIFMLTILGGVAFSFENMNSELNAATPSAQPFHHNSGDIGDITFGTKQYRQFLSEGGFTYFLGKAKLNNTVEYGSPANISIFDTKANTEFEASVNTFEKDSVEKNDSNLYSYVPSYRLFTNSIFSTGSDVDDLLLGYISDILKSEINESSIVYAYRPTTMVFRDQIGHKNGNDRVACVFNGDPERVYGCTIDTVDAYKGDFYPVFKMRTNNLIYILPQPIANDKTASGTFANVTMTATNLKLGLLDASQTLTIDVDNSRSLSITKNTEDQEGDTLKGKREFSYTYSGSGDIITALLKEKNSNEIAMMARFPASSTGTIELNFNTVGKGDYVLSFFSESINASSSNGVSAPVSYDVSIYDELENIEEVFQTAFYFEDAYTGKDDANNVLTSTALSVTGGNQGKPTDASFAGVTYEIIQSEVHASDAHANDYLKFKISLKGDYPSDASGFAQYHILAATKLEPQEYFFMIKVTDENGAFIKKEASIVVYPSDKQVTYTQYKNKDGIPSKDGTTFFTLEEIQATAFNLAIMEFSTDANILDLKSQGYEIRDVKFLEADTDTVITNLIAEVGSDDTTWYLKKANNTITSGTKKFDIRIEFYKRGTATTTATILKKGQELYIPGTITIANPDALDTALTGTTYGKQFAPIEVIGNENEIKIVASDQSDITSTNPDMRYCIANATSDGCATDKLNNAYISLVNDEARGTATATIKGPGTEKRVVPIMAYLMKDSSISSYKILEIEVLPATQELSWVGTSITNANGDITQVSGATDPTWELNLSYIEPKDGETIEENNTYTIETLYKNSTPTANQIGIRSNVVEGTTAGTPALDIDMSTISYDDPADIGAVEIVSGNLIFHRLPIGKVSIQAIANATGNYGPTVNVDDPTTPSVNENKSATLRINVSEKPKVTYTPDYVKNPIVGDAFVNGTGRRLGQVDISPAEAGFTYTIHDKIEILTTAKNPLIPGSEDVYTEVGNDGRFVIKNADEIWAGKELSAGTYKVQVKGKKVDGGEVTEADPGTITLVVENANLDVSKMEWAKLEAEDTAFSTITGEILTPSNTHETGFSIPYEDGLTFQVKVQENLKDYLKNATITYSLDGPTGYIEVNATGKVTVLKVGEEGKDVRVKANIKKTNFKDIDVYLPIEITSGASDFEFVNASGKAYPLDTDASTSSISSYQALKLTYAEIDTNAAKIPVFTKNAPTGTTVTIKIKSLDTAITNDVMAFNKDDKKPENASNNLAEKSCTISAADYETQNLSACQVYIQNAISKASEEHNFILEATFSTHATYAQKTLQMPINIEKAEQDFAFRLTKDSVEQTESSTYSPVFKETTKSTGLITLSIFDEDGNMKFDFEDGSLSLGPESNDPALTALYTKGISSFKYAVLLKAGEAGQSFRIFAKKKGDRNYKDMNTFAFMDIQVEEEVASAFDVEVHAFPSESQASTGEVITYGDDYFELIASTDEDVAGDTYTYEIDDSAKEYIEVYGTQGNTFKPLKAGKAKINIVRNSDGVLKTSSYRVTIQPKRMKMKINDLELKVGQTLTSSMFRFTDESETFLPHDQDVIPAPTFHVKKGSEEVSLTTPLRLEDDNAKISANFDALNATLSNYKITNMNGLTSGVEEGVLRVKQDKSDASWYEIKPGVFDNGESTTLGEEGWYNGPVVINLNKETSNEYDRISTDALTWSEEAITIKEEGDRQVPVHFLSSGGMYANAIATAQSATIKIDMRAPRIHSISGEVINTGKLAKFINVVSFNHFYSPGQSITIEAIDEGRDESVKSSGVKDISYKIYEIDDNGIRGDLYKEGVLPVDAKGVAKFEIQDLGKYEVCATSTDKAGNVSDEACTYVNIKKINVDVDDDGDPDFVDSDGDGCPDLNIDINNDNIIDINIDKNKDGVPELNIDTNGDGLPDINIDVDGDGNADINRVDLKKGEWNPSLCVTSLTLADGTVVAPYCTDPNIRPEYNMDSTGDGIANINLDRKDGIAHTEMVKVEAWKPTMCTTTFCTDPTFTAVVNFDTTKSGYPDVNVDLDGDYIADLNIDTNGDRTPNVNIDGNGDGKANINVDSNGDGEIDGVVTEIKEWKPAFMVNMKIAYETMEIKGGNDSLSNNGVSIKNPDGSEFPSNYRLKVVEITSNLDDVVKKELETKANGKVLKVVYEVTLLENNVKIQPTNELLISIPYPSGVVNPKIFVEQKGGSYQEVNAKETNGNLEYTASYLGKVSVFADPDDKPSTSVPSTSVLGNYNSGTGGAETGDSTSIGLYIVLGGFSLLGIYIQVRKKNNM